MGNQVNIPTLRFPEFSELWSEKTFGDLYSFKPTNSFSRDMLNYEAGEVKNIHYGDIHTKFNLLFDIEKEIVPYINSDIKISGITEENYIQEGDLILADASEDYNDIGKSIEVLNLNNEKVLSGLHTILARRKTDDLTIGFVAFLMKTYNVRLEIMRIAQGTKVLGLSSRRLAEIPLWIPKPEEQTKIATFLRAIDMRINLLTNQKEQLELYKKGLMHKIFSQELRFKDENGEDFPEWEEKRLGDIVEINKGEQLNKDELTEVGKYPCINGGISPSGFTDKFNCSENTIAMSEGGASCGYLNFIKTKFWSGGHCYTFKLKEIDGLKTIYLFQLLKYYETEIMKLRVGSGLPNIQKKDIVKFKLNFSNSAPEQQKIANYLSFIDNQIEKVSELISMSLEYKKGLLQKLFV